MVRYSKRFIIIICFILGACAADPVIVDVKKQNDSVLQCNQIEVELQQAERLKVAAREEDTFQTRYMFPPTAFLSIWNMNRAEGNAIKRIEYLKQLKAQKRCHLNTRPPYPYPPRAGMRNPQIPVPNGYGYPGMNPGSVNSYQPHYQRAPMAPSVGQGYPVPPAGMGYPPAPELMRPPYQAGPNSGYNGQAYPRPYNPPMSPSAPSGAGSSMRFPDPMGLGGQMPPMPPINGDVIYPENGLDQMGQ